MLGIVHLYSVFDISRLVVIPSVTNWLLLYRLFYFYFGYGKHLELYHK